MEISEVHPLHKNASKTTIKTTLYGILFIFYLNFSMLQWTFNHFKDYTAKKWAKGALRGRNAVEGMRALLTGIIIYIESVGDGKNAHFGYQ